QPVVSVGAHWCERQPAFLRKPHVSVAVPPDGGRERRGDDVIGAECRGQLLHRRIGIVRFRGDECHVGIVLFRYGGKAPRSIRDLQAERTQQFAEVIADRTLADDVDFHASVEPKPSVPRRDGGSSSTGSNAARDTGPTTIWAMRSPRRTTNGSEPKFASTTHTCPR